MKRIYSKPMVHITATIGTTSILAGSDPTKINTPIKDDEAASGAAYARRRFGFDDFSDDNTSACDLFISKESRGMWE